jgi:hypothetical protein
MLVRLAQLLGGISVLKAVQAFGEQKKGGGAAAAGAAPKPVEAGVGTALALKYVDDVAKVSDKTLKVDRQGVPFAKQNCAGCMLYKKTNAKIGGKEYGECALFPGQVVNAAGWCTSWSKKPS